MGNDRQTTFQFSIASAENPGVGEPVLLTGNFEDSIAKASGYGYQAIEIHVQDPDNVSTEALKKACSLHHICVSGIATGLAYAKEGLCLIHEDRDIRRKAVRRLIKFVDMAKELNTVLLIGRLKGDIRDRKRYDYWEQMLAEGMSEVAGYALESGVELMLEAINRYESNYMNKAGEIVDFIRRYGIPATKVLMDVFHMNIEEVSITETIRKYRGELGYFHIADSNRMYPGAGHVELTPVFETLHRENYRGYISLECLRIPDGEAAAKKGIEYLKAMNRKLM